MSDFKVKMHQIRFPLPQTSQLYLRGGTSKEREGKANCRKQKGRREREGVEREGKGGRVTLHIPCRKFLATPLNWCNGFLPLPGFKLLFNHLTR